MNNNNAVSEREKIAARLREARLSSGLSQNQAADKLKLQRPAISEIESGRRKVSAEEIVQFADLYRVDASWLLAKEEHNGTYANEQLKFAARELSKLSQEDIQKVLQIIKILPK